ncbi:MAG TPA: hypothetical protein VF895_00875 [Gaiellaceae bacterium]
MDPQARYEEIADDLAARNADVSLGQMMGMPCIKAGSKMIGGFWHDAMVFKLPEEEVREQTLALEGARLFDPSEKRRPFREWVEVPAAHSDEWPRLAEAALTLHAG